MHVFEQTKPVLLVCREDGDWSFLCGEVHPQEAGSIRAVGLGHVLARNPDLKVLHDLGPDEEAERSAPGQPWVRTPLSPEQ
jgi:hypothetical protein